MAYFLGSDAEVVITTEVSDKALAVTQPADGDYTLTSTSGTAPASGFGINSLVSANQDFPADALVDITGIDIGIGAMDEDIDYLGHNTPLKAEVRKNTTVTLTLKKKNVVFDVMYSGDADGATARYGLNSNGNLKTGLEEPDIYIGYRLLIKLKGSKEIFCVRNCQMTAHNITLTPDGVQEQSIEFTSMVAPLINTSNSGLFTNTAVGDI